MKLVKEFARNKNNLRFAVVHAKAPKVAQYYTNQLSREFGITNISILPVAPVLGAHAGIGAAAIGIAWDD